MQRELTVSRLNAYIAGVFDDESVLHGISVRGEVTECRIAGSRTFITLSEGGCTLSCVAFTAVDGITVGVEAVLIGSVSFHKKSGKTSFIAENVIVTDKRGAMLAELMKLKEKLAAEGLFAEPFVSRWLFDVELLRRMPRERACDAIYEYPLPVWRDVGGSKLKLRHAFRIFLELWRVMRHYR